MVALAHSEELAWLIERRAAEDTVGVSLYMPTHRGGGRQLRQDHTRYKNLLKSAKDQLVSFGLRPVQSRDALRAAQLLGDDGDFWRQRDLGLAMFIFPHEQEPADRLRYWDLPYSVPEHVHVGRRLLLRPLIPHLARRGMGVGRFYVLILNQKNLQLSVAVDDRLEPVEIEGMPAGMQELQQFIDAEKSLQFHTGTGSPVHATGERRAMFHGHGSNDARENDRVAELLRQVDQAIAKVLKGKTAPLIPLGVDSVVRLFQENTSYPHMTEEFIHGSDRHRTEHEVLIEAMHIADRLFDRELEQALAEYTLQRGTSGTTADSQRIVAMAMVGQIHLLLINLEAELWGTADKEAATAVVHRARSASDEDLIECAALYTLQTGGEVIALPPDRMPEAGAMAAVLRRGALAVHPGRL